jgi:uncharacterized membrane protein
MVNAVLALVGTFLVYYMGYLGGRIDERRRKFNK